jgi:cysteine synthase A
MQPEAWRVPRPQDRLVALAAALQAVGAREGACAGPCAAIGRTPLMRLRGGRAPRAEVLAKVEGRNPGGSIKDRTALGMVLDARARGLLPEGATLVEPTAGNTGIGLALVGRALGLEVVVVLPERYALEKRQLCQALGARVITVPGCRAGMAECRELSHRVARECGGVVLDQFSNPANPAVHELTTGEEIDAAVDGRIDALVLGVGTGGTLTGVARRLLRAHEGMQVVAVQSQAGTLGGWTPLPSRVEGIGSTFVPDTLDLSLISAVRTVTDEDAFRGARDLAATNGLIAGLSSGAVVHAAMGVAADLGPGARVVTLLPDGGDRYWSKDLYPNA